MPCREVLQQVFQLPTALAYPLFYKLAQPGASTVTLHAVRSWIVQHNVMQVPFRCMLISTLELIGFQVIPTWGFSD